MTFAKSSLFIFIMSAGSAMSSCKSAPEVMDLDGLQGGAGSRSDEELTEALSCDDDDECDDSLFCNGQERCEDGFCRRGETIDCNDDSSCTLDRCDEALQLCQHTPPDQDGDGHADENCLDADGASLGDDCDDEDPLSYPGNMEVCDESHRDEDCNAKTLGRRDADQDGYQDSLCCNVDGDGELSCGNDCDDQKSNVNPDAAETCDYLDNNCDGDTDEGVSITMYPDADHDGHGDSTAKGEARCPNSVGFALYRNDCDDSDPEVFDGQFEICDGKDNNCDANRSIDEIEEQAPWYLDVDGDGYGDPGSTPVLSCYRIAGRVMSRNDCQDQDDKVNPHATEICDGLDNDCNGLSDFKLAGANNFEDDDGDGVGDAECGGDDCNDRDPRTAGGAEEVCDHVDNDCDGEIDEQTVQNIWYTDEDGDGWGVVLGTALASCEPLDGRASKFGDCDDAVSNVHPGTVEYCDNVDNDCDGEVDEGAAVHCNLPNAIADCQAGACVVFSCLPGFIPDNSDPEAGCKEGTSGPSTQIACAADDDCNDHNLCSGTESCVGGFCQAGTPINCASGPTVVQGDVIVQSGLDILALAGIEFITGDLSILNTSLSSLVGLESLRRVGGSILIQSNTHLQRLSGSALSNLLEVGGDIVISDNPSLTNIDLPSLISTYSLQVIANQQLASVSGYASLSQIGNLLMIGYSGNLTGVSGFNSLAHVGGEYDLGHPLVDRSSCDGQSGLVIEQNASLDRVDAFEGLVSIAGDLCVSDFIGDEFALPELTSVEGAFSYSQNTSGGVPLERLELPALHRVGYDVSVQAETPGLDLSSLTELGSTGFEASLRICTGKLASDGVSYEHASCSELERISGHNTLRAQESCNQCPGDTPSPID